MRNNPNLFGQIQTCSVKSKLVRSDPNLLGQIQTCSVKSKLVRSNPNPNLFGQIQTCQSGGQPYNFAPPTVSILWIEQLLRLNGYCFVFEYMIGDSNPASARLETKQNGQKEAGKVPNYDFRFQNFFVVVESITNQVFVHRDKTYHSICNILHNLPDVLEEQKNIVGIASVVVCSIASL